MIRMRLAYRCLWIGLYVCVFVFDNMSSIRFVICLWFLCVYVCLFVCVFVCASVSVHVCVCACLSVCVYVFKMSIREPGDATCGMNGIAL